LHRILGSAHDAEGTLQETLLAAWQGLATFEGRSSVRTWLYQIRHPALPERAAVG
jgi:DNA-directed RNA polymerase specialized sigma24 family protein